MSINDKVTAALSRAEPLSFTEAAALLGELVPALAAVKARMMAIHPGGGNIPQGADYKRAATLGTAEEVERLQAEHRRLSAEVAQLEAKREALAQARNAARIREAIEGLPGFQTALVSRIEAAEAAQKALEEAFDGVQAAYDCIAQARGTLQAASRSHDAEGAAQSTINRLMALAPFAERRRTIHHHDPSLHADRLGAPKPATMAEWLDRQQKPRAGARVAA